jgi:hypothetical protein
MLAPLDVLEALDTLDTLDTLDALEAELELLLACAIDSVVSAGAV